MTEAEKRRKNYPAVHPRYRAAYHSLYRDEPEETKKSSFGVRVVISVFILTLFILFDYRQDQIGTVDSQYIISAVQKDLLSQ